MSVPVPFGQYVRGDSLVHQLEPRAKLGITVAFTIAIFFVNTWAGMVVMAALVFAAVAGARVPLRLVARGIAPISLLLAFTVVANGLRWGADPSAILHLGLISVDGPGLVTGLFLSCRIIVLVMGTTLVTLTTSPVALTDALVQLMRPLSVLRFPAEDVAMMLSVALRFIPTTAEEAEKIVVAQASRGARFGEGGPVARTRAYIPVLIPLFVSLFRRADELAVAMEARCYSGAKRTRLRQSIMQASDWVALVAGVVLLVGVAVYL